LRPSILPSTKELVDLCSRDVALLLSSVYRMKMAVPLTTLIYQISHKLPILKVINQSRYGAPPCGEHKVNLVFIDVHPPKYGILGFDLCLLYDGSEMIDFKAVLG